MDPQNNPQNQFSALEKEFRGLAMIFNLLLAFQIALACLLVLTNISGSAPLLNELFLYIAPCITFSSIVLGHLLYVTRKKKAQHLKSMKEKIQWYKSSNIVRWACMEGGNIFSLTAYLITSNLVFIFTFLIGILAFALSKASPEKFLKEFSINSGGTVKVFEELEEKQGAYFLRKYPWAAWVLIVLSLGSAYFTLTDFITPEDWSQEEKIRMVENCVNETGLENYYPQEARSYCECANERIINKYSYKELWEHRNLAPEEKHRLYKDITDACFIQNFGEVLMDTIVRKAEGR